MIVRLSEIPENGLDLEFSEKNKELSSKLKEYMGNQPFNAKIHILPIGDGFDLRGGLEGELPLTCSFCAKDFKLSLREKFHEVLFLGNKNSRKFQESGNLTDPELFVRNLDTDDFDVDEFLHEINGLAVPFQPQCQEACKGLCSGCGSDLNSEKCTCDPEKNRKSSPFSVLKKLKVH